MNGLIKRNNTDSEFFDDFFEGFFPNASVRTTNTGMRTDIKESDKGYTLDIDVPGFGKEDIKITLENGYLTIEARREESKESKEAHYLRRERYFGQTARTFYVGDGIAQEDIHAAYDKGILSLQIPKQGTLIKEKKYISIQ
jgi:HSP20 family protein